jgi:hypothetical protein
MSEVRLRRARPVAVKEEAGPRFGNPGKPVEMLIRIQPYNGEVLGWFELYAEIRDVLSNHFGSPFFERDGRTHHVEIVMINSGRK